ncbi:HAMP domain-containing histidine kinase [Paenibacillus sp. GSMTC-2017]|uniref:sensor histidine kinase n=1 Tax=Paenibacillus sp. GSMTC-2017 TaxID=2794350 RepID=UPI0018D9474F|nr:HAMP domain-containing sensor histidine kinase [Paenibacillus sp. GSMTC-2017]MBH5320127.1 HAMP domain-containing histidine kinase [Paenibacillus sp. GSMTC-2017]
MNMKRRLALKFILQLVIAGLASLLIIWFSANWINQQFADISISRDFASIGLDRLVESSKLTKDGIVFDQKLLDQVKQNKGWLQSLDENGRVEQSFNTPSDVPKQYIPGEFAGYITKRIDFPYDVYFWVREKNGKLFTLIYGVRDELTPLLNQVSKEAKFTSNKKLELPIFIQEKTKALGGYIQLLDEKGRELVSYNKPTSIAEQYNLRDLAIRTIDQEQAFQLASFYNSETKLTWLVALPRSSSGSNGEGAMVSEETKVLFIGVGTIFIAIIALFVLLSLWNAHRFGGPLLHMLVWLDSLGKSIYEEPSDRKGIVRSRTRSGRWRSRYRVFMDVMNSIQKLSETLQQNDELRKQNNRLREEWISGITHDLKTPLSSIKGYAHMLSEESYEWNVEEVRKFSTIMLEKSGHMDMLINDLAMTYRLSAGVDAPEGDKIELNEWLRAMLDQVAVNPSFDKSRILFRPAEKRIVVELYTPWLERVIMNIAANALIHNPPETILTVTLYGPSEQSSMTITLSDNGRGMDELSASKLFDRYYRGTNTSSMIEGSGLGMAISKSLVEAMGGNITVKTSIGNGTTIQLSWPLLAYEAEKE